MCDSLSTDLISLLTNLRIWQCQVARKSCVFTLSCGRAPRINWNWNWMGRARPAVEHLSQSESVAVTRSAEQVAPDLRNSDAASPTAPSARTRSTHTHTHTHTHPLEQTYSSRCRASPAFASLLWTHSAPAPMPVPAIVLYI